MRRMNAGRVAATALGVGLLGVIAIGCSTGAALAQGAGCQVLLNGTNAATAATSSDAIQVSSDSTLTIVATGAEDTRLLVVSLAFGPVRWQVREESVVGGQASVEVPISTYSRYGAGLYQVEATAGSCSETAWVRVTGQPPIRTVAGVASAAVALIGLVLVLWGIVAGGPTRGVVGGALLGLGALVFLQQWGKIGITTPELVVWTTMPGGVGGITAGLRRGFARSRARHTLMTGPPKLETGITHAKPPEPETGITHAKPPEFAEAGAPPPPPPPPPVRPVPRRVVGRVQLPGSAEAITTALRPGALHEFHARIGFAGPREVAANRPLDESSLPKDDRPHQLRIAFQEIGAIGVVGSGAVSLPPTGESDPVVFPFVTGQGGTFAARVIVSYRNRVLQTTRFEADLDDGQQRPADQPPIRLFVETNARPSMVDPDRHPGFDLALVVNHDQDGGDRMLVLHEGEPSVFDTGPVQESVKWFEDTLSKLADQPERYQSLESNDTVKLLHDMAIRGHDLFTHLQDWQVSDQVIHPTLGRVQLVPGRPDSYFPLEFVYEKDLPGPTAVLCPHAKEALAQGACTDQCPPGGDQHAVVCPIGFWCLSRVIERQPFLRSRHLDTEQDELLAEPLDGRDALPLFSGAVYGASARVDTVQPGSIQRVSDALARAVGASVAPIGHWADWRKAVADTSPSTLVAVCHTEERREAGEPVLQFEIGQPGDHDWLGVNEIDPSDVKGPQEAAPPLVLLIGCSTGVQRVAFQDSVAAFMRSGAAIVVSTIGTVLGEYASQITAALIDELARIRAQGNAAFGDALLNVRRTMLANDMPMVLTITAFGDAEWRLAATPAPG